MAEVSIALNGRPYEISCDDGQEGRIVDLGTYIDHRLQQIARSGGAYNDTHLMVLATLVIADELFEAKEALRAQTAAATASGRQAQLQTRAQPGLLESKEDEKALARVLDQLAKRIEGIAAKVQTA